MKRHSKLSTTILPKSIHKDEQIDEIPPNDEFFEPIRPIEQLDWQILPKGFTMLSLPTSLEAS